MQRQTGLIVMMLLAVAFMIYLNSIERQAVVLPKPEVLLQQAREEAKSAGTDRKKLGRAIRTYEVLTSAKEYKHTEYAAQARLEIAILRETRLKDYPRAINDYKALLREFSPKESKAAAEGFKRLQWLKEETIRRNSKHTLYKIIDRLVALTGKNPNYSYALALVIITVVFKVLTWPLSHAQFKSMKEMQRIQPLVKEIQEKYKGNQKEMGERIMALYKEHGVNPFASCLPLLVQLPVLYLLYYMVRLYEFEFANGKFLWIGSKLAAKYPSILGSSLAERDIPLVIIYTISMFVSQRMTVVDPTQAEQQKIMSIMMPLMFAFLFWSFPSAFMLYGLCFNIVSTVQQYYVLKAKGEEGGPAGGDASPAGKTTQVVTTRVRTPVRSRRRRRKFQSLPVRLPPIWAIEEGI